MLKIHRKKSQTWKTSWSNDEGPCKGWLPDNLLLQTVLRNAVRELLK